jgi:serine/threonine protein kinase
MSGELDSISVPGYTLAEEIGRGGGGVVYAAIDQHTGREVAVKVIRAGPADRLRRQFLREARAAQALRHPGIVPVHEHGAREDLLYLVMDRVPGPDLQQVLDRDGPLPVTAAVDLVGQVAAAAAALHAAGVVHCDIKPANVLVAELAANRTTDPATDPANNPANNPATDPANDRAVDPAGDAVADRATDPATDPAANRTTDPATDPGTDPGTDPANNRATDPANDRAVDPAGHAVADRATDPATDPANNPANDPANNPANDRAVDPAGHAVADRAAGRAGDRPSGRAGHPAGDRALDRPGERTTGDLAGHRAAGGAGDRPTGGAGEGVLGRVLLTDFGVAEPPLDSRTVGGLTADPEWLRSAGSSRSGELAGAGGGTYAFMAPEQWGGGAVDARTDVYGLGGLLYAALTGAPPHAEATLPELVYAVIMADPPHPASRDGAIPAALDGVVATAMARDPADRFGSAEEFAAALRAAATGQPAAAGQPAGPGRVRRWLGARARPRRRGLGIAAGPRRCRLLVAAAAVVALGLAGAGALAWWPGRHGDQDRVVCAHDITLRPEPASRITTATLRHGDRVRVTASGRSGKWVLVTTADGRRGWAVTQFLAKSHCSP